MNARYKVLCAAFVAATAAGVIAGDQALMPSLGPNESSGHLDKTASNALHILKEYKKGVSDPDITAKAVHAASLSQDPICIEPLAAIIDFVYPDKTVDSNIGLPYEKNFPVVDALAQIGAPALNVIGNLLEKESSDSLKGQLARRTLVLIKGSDASAFLEALSSTSEPEAKANLAGHIAELKLESK